MTSPLGPAFDAVFFISFGGPEKSEDVMPFLEIVTRGRGIPPARLQEVAHHYERMGGASPINAITRAQAASLKRYLAEAGRPLPVYIGQRNWDPFIEDTLRAMARDGIRHAAGFITAAQRCEASWERYVNAVEEARRKIGPSAPQIDYPAPWFDHPLFIEAVASRVQDVLDAYPSARGPETSWIFTAHSIPTPMAQASHYVQELETVAKLVAQKFNKEWTLAYTSRSGKPADPWVEPGVCDAIGALAKKGVRQVLTIPIGFVADHVEVLFDLDVEAKEAAREAGLVFFRAGTVGNHPKFIAMIADVVGKTAANQNGGISRAAG